MIERGDEGAPFVIRNSDEKTFELIEEDDEGQGVEAADQLQQRPLAVGNIRRGRPRRQLVRYHGIRLELAGFALDARGYMTVNDRLDPHSYKDLR